jgi:hypothetical protein
MGSRRFFIMFGLIAALVIITACNTDGSESPAEEDGKTYVEFNSNSIFRVSVYRDSGRISKLTDVEPLESIKIESLPNGNGEAFYLAYQVDIEGIAFPYHNEQSFTVIRIDEGKTNMVSIPELASISINTVYVKILHEGDGSLSFRQGSAELRPQGASGTILMNGETGVYQIQAGPVSGSSFMKNTVTSLSYPAEITEFQAGYFYTFSYNGTAIALVRATPVTIAAITARDFTFTWSGSWTQIGPNQYTSNSIGHGQSTWETLRVTTSTGCLVTVKLTASSEDSRDFGYGSKRNGSPSAEDYQIRASGTESKTQVYTIPQGTHCLYFGYVKDHSMSQGTDRVSVEVTGR